MIKEIPLNNSSEVAKIDDIDYSIVKNFNWYLFKTSNLKYAQAQIRFNKDKILSPITFKEINYNRKYPPNHKWHKTSIYRKGFSKRVFLHRLILNTPKGMETDHINGNGLDNRRENLRICTRSQNGKNRRISKNNSSGYIGISYCNTEHRRKRWVAAIRSDHIKMTLGRFYTKEEAALVYNKAALKYHGKFAKLNILESELVPQEKKVL